MRITLDNALDTFYKIPIPPKTLDTRSSINTMILDCSPMFGVRDNMLTMNRSSISPILDNTDIKSLVHVNNLPNEYKTGTSIVTTSLIFSISLSTLAYTGGKEYINYYGGSGALFDNKYTPLMLVKYLLDNSYILYLNNVIFTRFTDPVCKCLGTKFIKDAGNSGYFKRIEIRSDLNKFVSPIDRSGSNEFLEGSKTLNRRPLIKPDPYKPKLTNVDIDNCVNYLSKWILVS